MDKDKEQHMKEYATQIKYLEERLKITKGLYDKLKSEEGIDVPVEHDFPNYRRYDKAN